MKKILFVAWFLSVGSWGVAAEDAVFSSIVSSKGLKPQSALKFTEEKKVFLPGKGKGSPTETLGDMGIALRFEQNNYWTDDLYSAKGYNVTQGLVQDDQGRLGQGLRAYKISAPSYGPKHKFAASHNDLYFNVPEPGSYKVLSFRKASEVSKDEATSVIFKNGLLVEEGRIEATSPGLTVFPDLTLNDLKGDRVFLLIPMEKVLMSADSPLPGLEASVAADTGKGLAYRFIYDMKTLGKVKSSSGDDQEGPAPVYGQSQRYPLFVVPGKGLEIGFQDQGTQELKVLKIGQSHSTSQLILPGARPFFSALTRDDENNYYYITGDKGINPPVNLSKADGNGKLLKSTRLGNGEDEFNLYTVDSSTANLAWSPEGLGLTSSRTMQDGGDGLHHQGSFGALFDTQSLAVKRNHGQLSGHSFENRLVWDGKDFLTMDLGDNYPRGIIIHRMGPTKIDGRVIFTFKTEMGREPSPYRRGKDGKPLPAGRWSNDNRTYTELGDIIPTSSGILGVFASEKSIDNSLATGELNESRNLGLVLVRKDFEKVKQTQNIVPEALILSKGKSSPEFRFYTFDGNPVGQKNSGVVWLTDYENKKKATAARPKAVDIGGGEYLILWEKWTDKEFLNLNAVIVDEMGKAKSKILDLGSSLRLPRGDRVTYYQGKVLWVTSQSGNLELNVWDLKL